MLFPDLCRPEQARKILLGYFSTLTHTSCSTAQNGTPGRHFAERIHNTRFGERKGAGRMLCGRENQNDPRVLKRRVVQESGEGAMLAMGEE